MFIYVCKILCQSCLSATITMLVLVLQWVLEYLYLINIQSVQCVHHSPSVLSLHCCTCPVCYPTHRPILDLAACRATPACQVIYYPAYTQDLAGYIPLLEYRTD